MIDPRPFLCSFIGLIALSSSESRGERGWKHNGWLSRPGGYPAHTFCCFARA
jgi:hypothetical protein